MIDDWRERRGHGHRHADGDPAGDARDRDRQHRLFAGAAAHRAGDRSAIPRWRAMSSTTLGYRRYEWKCNALNAPSRRAARRLGFTFEGIFRQHMIVKGRNRDTAWFAMTRQRMAGASGGLRALAGAGEFRRQRHAARGALGDQRGRASDRHEAACARQCWRWRCSRWPATAQAGAASAAKPYQLAPWKDELFQYPEDPRRAVWRRLSRGRVRPAARPLCPRHRARREGRPEIRLARHRARSRPISSFDAAGTTLKYFAVGKSAGGAKAIVIYHPRARQPVGRGVDDWIHGGNFNRIKNLMMRNDGVYLSPSFSDFRRRGRPRSRR